MDKEEEIGSINRKREGKGMRKEKIFKRGNPFQLRMPKSGGDIRSILGIGGSEKVEGKKEAERKRVEKEAEGMSEHEERLAEYLGVAEKVVNHPEEVKEGAKGEEPKEVEGTERKGRRKRRRKVKEAEGLGI